MSILSINVNVKTRSKSEGVEKTSPSQYTVRVNTLPVKGKANKRVIELLANYFDISKSSITLIRGAKSKIKVFKIEK